MVAALGVMTLYFLCDWDSDPVVISAMFLYVGGYQVRPPNPVHSCRPATPPFLLPPPPAPSLLPQVGFGPVSWLLISEVFPLEVRSEGMALAVQNNFFWNLVVSLLFSVELDYIGASASFGIFFVIAVASLVFVHLFVPETKGLSLEAIEAMLDEQTFSPFQRRFGGSAPGKAKAQERSGSSSKPGPDGAMRGSESTPLLG